MVEPVREDIVMMNENLQNVAIEQFGKLPAGILILPMSLLINSHPSANRRADKHPDLQRIRHLLRHRGNGRAAVSSKLDRAVECSHLELPEVARETTRATTCKPRRSKKQHSHLY